MAANALDIRMAHLEGAYEQIDKRLDGLHGDFREVRSDIRILDQKLDRLVYWLLGVLIAVLATLASSLVGLLMHR